MLPSGRSAKALVERQLPGPTNSPFRPLLSFAVQMVKLQVGAGVRQPASGYAVHGFPMQRKHSCIGGLHYTETR